MDDDGTPYLSFVRFNDGNNVWIAELEKDLITLKKETMRLVFMFHRLGRKCGLESMKVLIFSNTMEFII